MRRCVVAATASTDPCPRPHCRDVPGPELQSRRDSAADGLRVIEGPAGRRTATPSSHQEPLAASPRAAAAHLFPQTGPAENS